MTTINDLRIGFSFKWRFSDFSDKFFRPAESDQLLNFYVFTHHHFLVLSSSPDWEEI